MIVKVGMHACMFDTGIVLLCTRREAAHQRFLLQILA